MAEWADPFEDDPHLKVFTTCGIAGQNFEHWTDSGERAAENARMIEYLQKSWGHDPVCNDGSGCIDLRVLIARQAERYMYPESIGSDAINTYYDCGPDGEYLWWSHRRWVEEGQNGPDGRNGIFVVYRE